MNDPQADFDKETRFARWMVEHADDALKVASDAARDPLKLSTKLRKRFDIEHTRALCSLAEVRSKATAKFANAERMFFTSVGYQQSTSQAIAGYKARRFAEAKFSDVVDLCCGVGGDAIWLSEHVELTFVDRSATCVEFAAANLRVHGRQGQGVVDDLRCVELSRFDAWHIDPDRRIDGSRRSAPDHCEPPLNEFLNLPGLPRNGAIKLAPAADATDLLSRGAELEWIGCQQECRQQVAWFGDLARYPGRRSATWILGAQCDEAGEFQQLVQQNETHAETNEAFGELGEFLYEPRASVIAAGLTSELASQFGLRSVRGTAYLTGDDLHESSLFQSFRVLSTDAFHLHALAQRLSDIGVRVTEVKKRGVDVDPVVLLRKLSNAVTKSAAQNVAVFLFPKAESIRYAIAVRVETE